MIFKEIIDVYSKIKMSHVNTLCGRDAEIFNVKELGKYIKFYSQRIKFKRKIKEYNNPRMVPRSVPANIL
jgi:hypothetical protein